MQWLKIAWTRGERDDEGKKKNRGEVKVSPIFTLRSACPTIEKEDTWGENEGKRKN